MGIEENEEMDEFDTVTLEMEDGSEVEFAILDESRWRLKNSFYSVKSKETISTQTGWHAVYESNHG